MLDACSSCEDVPWGRGRGSIVSGDSVDLMASGCCVEVASTASDMRQHVLHIGNACDWTCSE